MRGNHFSVRMTAVLAVFGLTVLVTGTAALAQQETVLFSFGGTTDFDGCRPDAALIADAAGNLYGTTSLGGEYGIGTIFQLIPGSSGWTEKILYSFGSYDTDGFRPEGTLVFDSSGNLYGTTYGGGIYNSGTVFELRHTPTGAWHETLLYSFQGSGDVVFVSGNLALDSSGNLYGTTALGGDYAGTVFELPSLGDGKWNEKFIYTFDANGAEGTNPNSVILDSAGNLYGTTSTGGAHDGGNVFRLSPTSEGRWEWGDLYSFVQNSEPVGSLAFDSAGNLYGVTSQDGLGYFGGSTFELTPVANDWTESALYRFGPRLGGDNPQAGVTVDAAGNVYGTTYYGGTGSCRGGDSNTCGTVFELTPAGGGGFAETVLHNFDDNGQDGFYPDGSLLLDGAGNLYGTTQAGGTGSCGTVFEITP
jgi:uncharacterized repeat protein (TIGR03803 family)